MESKSLEEDATLLAQIQKYATENPDKPAYIFVDKDSKERVITRQELWDKARKFAAIIKRLGVCKGDIVCNTLANSPERVMTYYGTMASGAIPSHGQLFLADGSDLINNLKESKSRAIIYDPGDLNGALRILNTIKFTEDTTGRTCYKDLPNLKHIIEIETKGLEEAQRWINVIDNEQEMFLDEDISKKDIASVFPTSGTTGFSKLVPYTHEALLRLLLRYDDLGDFKEDTTVFNMQSLGWLGGFPGYYAASGVERITSDFIDGLPENMGEFLIKTFNRHGPDVAFLAPNHIQGVLDAIERGLEWHKQLHVLFTGGGSVHLVTMKAIGKITDKIIILYGGTEFSLVCANEIEHKSDFQDYCAGRPSHCEVRIVGDDEREVPTGEQGDIHVRSDAVFKGYLNNSAKTAAAFTEDGWCKTGDIGYFNKEGQLFVLCRKADAICKDGFIHYPGWLERLINNHPGLEKCIVIGIPDPIHGEDICLCFKKMPGVEVSIDDVREHCKELFLTDENDKMTPLPKHYLVFDDFITIANGKVDRKKIREEVLKRLNLDQLSIHTRS